jgi:hypothetical protein
MVLVAAVVDLVAPSLESTHEGVGLSATGWRMRLGRVARVGRKGSSRSSSSCAWRVPLSRPPADTVKAAEVYKSVSRDTLLDHTVRAFYEISKAPRIGDHPPPSQPRKNRKRRQGGQTKMI